jgi:hypothetical protein
MKKTFIIPAALVITATIAAGCGNTQSAARGTTTPTPARTSSPGASATSAASATSTPTSALSVSSCPSKNVVGSALGTTLPAPTVAPYQPTPALPPGASGISCLYLSGKKMVWVNSAANVPASYFDALKQGLAGGPLQLTPVSGLGDRAGYYLATYQSEPIVGVFAMKGTHFLDVETQGLPLSSSVTRIVSLEITLLKTLASGSK